MYDNELYKILLIKEKEVNLSHHSRLTTGKFPTASRCEHSRATTPTHQQSPLKGENTSLLVNKLCMFYSGVDGNSEKLRRLQNFSPYMLNLTGN